MTSTSTIHPDTWWIDPEDPTEELYVDYVHPLGTAYYHWRTPVNGQTIYGYRRLIDWPYVIKLDEPHRAVLAAIVAGPPRGVVQLWKDTALAGVPRVTFQRWVNALVDHGLVHKPKRGAGADEAGLRATDDGLEYLEAFSSRVAA